MKRRLKTVPWLLGAALLVMAVWWAVHPGDSVPGSVPARGHWAARPPTPSTGSLAPDSEMVKRHNRYRELMDSGVWTRECRGDFFQYVIEHQGLEAAWGFLDKVPAGLDRKEARSYLFQAWFCHDPAAVVAWIGDSKRSPAEQGFALVALTHSAYYNDSGGLRAPDLRVAFEALASIPDRIKYARELEEGAKVQLLDDFVKTNDVASLLGYLKESGLENDIPLALRARARRVPDDVIAYFDQKNEKMPDLIAVSVADGKAWDDPEAAVDFVQNHRWENGSFVGSSVDSVMRAYLTRDSMAASRKIGELSPGKVKDLCIMEMVGWLRQQGSAHEIANWLPAITNPATRKRAEELMNAPKER